MKAQMAAPQKQDRHVTPQPRFWVGTRKNLESRVLKRDLHTRTQSNIIRNGQKAEMTRVAITGKQNVVHTYQGISFSLQKEGNSDTWYKMDET